MKPFECNDRRVDLKSVSERKHLYFGLATTQNVISPINTLL